MQIANEGPDAEGKIRRVISEAFGRPNEAILVDELRRSGDLIASRVALDGTDVLGHAALSRLRSPAGCVALAPVAVKAARQRQGIGSALVQDCIAIARRRGHSMIFVLGDPNFYRRFGFTAEATRPFASQFSGRHLMAIQFGDIIPPTAPLDYAEPFDALE